MIFIDTTYLIALSMRADALHERAMAWSSRLTGPFLTTEYVLIELANALSAPDCRSAVCVLINGFFEPDSRTTVVSSSSMLFTDGMELYGGRRDKSWSLTDCISFLIMERNNVREALTHDHHYEQAGYTALLRHPPPSQPDDAA